MLLPETILQGRYSVVRQLGQGGMGAVYEAIDERLDTTVALKETLFADERLRKQFEREARLLARMHHPALPRVSDHFSEGDGQFLVMQYIAGEDLAEMMRIKQGPFPPDQVLTWGDQLLDALDYLHTQDPPIIHRDIKPQNLKLTSRGQIILLDFGLAKGQIAGVSVVTTSASIYGYTPNYAPLEQIQGLGTDSRSDIYALGATLYHLMTGVKPPDALTRAAALVNGQPDPLIPANQVSSFIGPEVAGVLARAMSQNREQRYSSASGMRAGLKGTSEVATISDRAEAATVVFQSPSSVPTVPGQSQTAMKTGETTVVQSQARPRSLAPWFAAAAAVVLVGALFGVYYAYQRRNTPTAVDANQSNVNEQSTVTTSPSPSEEIDVDLEPSAGTVPEDRKAEASVAKPEVTARKTVDKPKDKGENAAAAPKDAPSPPFVFDRNQFPSPTMIDPRAYQTEDDKNRLLRRQGQLPTIRNLPDGSKLITNTDGTRTLVMPNGTTRVLRRGERLQRLQQRRTAP